MFRRQKTAKSKHTIIIETAVLKYTHQNKLVLIMDGGSQLIKWLPVSQQWLHRDRLGTRGSCRIPRTRSTRLEKGN